MADYKDGDVTLRFTADAGSVAGAEWLRDNVLGPIAANRNGSGSPEYAALVQVLYAENPYAGATPLDVSKTERCGPAAKYDRDNQLTAANIAKAREGWKEITANALLWRDDKGKEHKITKAVIIPYTHLDPDGEKVPGNIVIGFEGGQSAGGGG